MKYLYIVLTGSMLLLTVSAHGQSPFPLYESNDSLRFRVVEKEGRLAAETLPGKRNRIIQSLELNDGDLLVTCVDPPRTRNHEELPRRFRMWLQVKPGKTIPVSLADTTYSRGSANTTRQIRGLDLMETTLELGGEYMLVVQKSTLVLASLVDCTRGRPAFTLKKRIPYYAVSGVALAVVGVGQFYNHQKQTDYQTYLDLWSERKTLPEAQPFFDTAQRNERIARYCFIGGAAVLLADAALFTGHWLKIRKKQRIYDRFCGKNESELGFQAPSPSFQLRPFTGYHAPFYPPSTGLSLVFNF